MKHSFKRILALIIILCMTLLMLPSCGSLGKTLMTLSKDGITVSISVNQYELLLSRSKGTLCAAGVTQNGATAASSAFWEYKDKFDGTTFQTYAEFYEQSILNTCKMYLIAKYLFEKNNLSLTQTQQEKIDAMMEELVRTDGGGSKSKLNAVLAQYGVNYDILRDFYETEMIVQAVQDHLYGSNASKVGDNVKHEYMNSHYVRFRQIYLSAEVSVYVTDKNGDVIYYQNEEGKTDRIFYDSGNGVAKELEDGSPETDAKGDVIYYKDTEYTRIAYNNKGTPQHVLNKDGSYKTREMTLEELELLDDRAITLFNTAKDTTVAEFEKLITDESDGDTDVSEYNEGVYLRTDLDYSLMGEDSAYLSDIVAALQEMKTGEVRKILSPTGYHIIRKYDNMEKAYSNAENEAYFTNFNSNLITYLFSEDCQKHVASIKIDEAILEAAPSMKTVGINYYF